MSNYLPLNGRITISGTTGGKHGRSMTIRVDDDASGIRLLNVDLTCLQFGEVLSGLACVPCEVEYCQSSNIGKKREHKTEHVFVEEGDFKTREERAAKAIEPFNVDGWQGSVYDATNHHNWTRKEPPDGKSGQWVRVGFTRFVEGRGEG